MRHAQKRTRDTCKHDGTRTHAQTRRAMQQCAQCGARARRQTPPGATRDMHRGLSPPRTAPNSVASGASPLPPRCEPSPPLLGALLGAAAPAGGGAPPLAKAPLFGSSGRRHLDGARRMAQPPPHESRPPMTTPTPDPVSGVPGAWSLRSATRVRTTRQGAARNHSFSLSGKSSFLAASTRGASGVHLRRGGRIHGGARARTPRRRR